MEELRNALNELYDRFGHNDGDFALQQISIAIKNACDRNQIFARYGGDEFIVFADRHTPEDAQKLIDKVDNLIGIDGHRIFLIAKKCRYGLKFEKGQLKIDEELFLRPIGSEV